MIHRLILIMIRQLIFTMVPGLFPSETRLLKKREQVEAEPPILRRGHWMPLNVIRPVCFIGFCCAMPVHLNAQQPWTNTTLSASQRASLLLNAMTFSDEAAMVCGTAGPTGSNYVGNIANNTRLGIPWLFLQDGPAGVADGVNNVTAFPAPITLAASWDVSLARQYGVMLGNEERGKGVGVVLGPMMNMARVYEDGRAFEGYGRHEAQSHEYRAIFYRVPGGELCSFSLDNIQQLLPRDFRHCRRINGRISWLAGFCRSGHLDHEAI